MDHATDGSQQARRRDRQGRAQPQAKPTKSAKTINNRLTVLNACLKRGVRWKIIPAMPCVIEIPAVDEDAAARQGRASSTVRDPSRTI